MLRKESKYIRPKSISYIEKRILMKRNDTKVRAKRYETWGEIACAQTSPISFAAREKGME